MKQNTADPEWLFETSWEVCNKVGGIYTVLATRARTLKEKLDDNLIFIGPDLWSEQESPWFEEDPFLLRSWVSYATTHDNLKIRVGRWMVPGSPIAILVKFDDFYQQKGWIYTKMWEIYQVDSLHSYGDYDDSCMFACAAGAIVESFTKFESLQGRNTDQIAAHFNEWQTAMGLLWVKQRVPQVATLFTTHATSIGRSIAGNHKPLYGQLSNYNGDQMAQELNMISKHSVEKAAAHAADSFTTVSDITASECAALLEKPVDVVTPNGFEDDFVPKGASLNKARATAKQRLTQVAESLLGYTLSKDPLFVVTAGRYEYKNKGIDTFIEAMRILNYEKEVERDIVAFIMVPAWLEGVREDLQKRLDGDLPTNYPLYFPFTTHWVHHPTSDKVLQQIHYSLFRNDLHDRVKMIFVPCYLNGSDGIFNMSYYELLPAMDIAIFPSYYEPWGYTPLESMAFGVSTITTDLAGYGQWIRSQVGDTSMSQSVVVLHRDDNNANILPRDIAEQIKSYLRLNTNQLKTIRKAAQVIAQKALWKNFISYYYIAYQIAFEHRDKRNK